MGACIVLHAHSSILGAFIGRPRITVAGSNIVPAPSRLLCHMRAGAGRLCKDGRGPAPLCPGSFYPGGNRRDRKNEQCCMVRGHYVLCAGGGAPPVSPSRQKRNLPSAAAVSDSPGMGITGLYPFGSAAFPFADRVHERGLGRFPG